MAYEFARTDRDLFNVVSSATADETALLVQMLRRAASCWVGKSCNDPSRIADEIQRLGGNSIANRLRGHGVRYIEIARDVGHAVGADLPPTDEVAAIEWAICE